MGLFKSARAESARVNNVIRVYYKHSVDAAQTFYVDAQEIKDTSIYFAAYIYAKDTQGNSHYIPYNMQARLDPNAISYVYDTQYFIIQEHANRMNARFSRVKKIATIGLTLTFIHYAFLREAERNFFTYHTSNLFGTAMYTGMITNVVAGHFMNQKNSPFSTELKFRNIVLTIFGLAAAVNALIELNEVGSFRVFYPVGTPSDHRDFIAGVLGALVPTVTILWLERKDNRHYTKFRCSGFFGILN